MKALILIGLLTFISCNRGDNVGNIGFFEKLTYKCPDEKLKLKDDLCAIYVKKYVYDSTSGRTNSDSVLYIKQKCGKNKHCLQYDDESLVLDSSNYEDVEYYTCVKDKLSLLKLGKKCSLNSECLSGFCKNNKCSTQDKCYRDENCGKGKYCDDMYTHTCKAYVNEGESCDNNYCGNGLKCYPEESTATNRKCVKFFSLDVGTKINYDSELCKTGIFSINDKKCVTFSKYDSTNKKVLCKDEGGNEVECKISYADVTFTNKNGEEVTNYSQGRFDLLGDLIKRYNKIKLNKLNEKEEKDYDYYDYYGDKKFAELKAVYDNYAILLDKGLIKENGKKNGDNKCEYEFWKSTISSSYINFCLGFALALLSLLI